MSLTGYANTGLNQSLNGIMTLTDGAGTIIENGTITTGDINSTGNINSTNIASNAQKITDVTYNLGSLTTNIANNLTVSNNFMGHLASYYDPTSSIQGQLNGIGAGLLGSLNNWSNTNNFKAVTTTSLHTTGIETIDGGLVVSNTCDLYCNGVFPTTSTGSVGGLTINSSNGGSGGSTYFLNKQGTGTGGFFFLNSSSSSAPTTLFSVDQAGNLSVSKGIFNTTVTSPFMTSSNIDSLNVRFYNLSNLTTANCTGFRWEGTNLYFIQSNSLTTGMTVVGPHWTPSTNTFVSINLQVNGTTTIQSITGTTATFSNPTANCLSVTGTSNLQSTNLNGYSSGVNAVLQLNDYTGSSQGLIYPSSISNTLTLASSMTNGISFSHSGTTTFLVDNVGNGYFSSAVIATSFLRLNPYGNTSYIDLCSLNPTSDVRIQVSSGSLTTSYTGFLSMYCSGCNITGALSSSGLTSTGTLNVTGTSTISLLNCTGVSCTGSASWTGNLNCANVYTGAITSTNIAVTGPITSTSSLTVSANNYDSGWFAISASTLYTRTVPTYSISKLPKFQVLYSTSGTPTLGTDLILDITGQGSDINFTNGYFLSYMSSTTVNISFASTICTRYNSGVVHQTSGFCKLVIVV